MTANQKSQTASLNISRGRELSKRFKQISLSEEFKNNRHINHDETVEGLLQVGKELAELGFKGAFDERLDLPGRLGR